jgi:ribosomal protein S18 acetylase RimI-like enzyme
VRQTSGHQLERAKPNSSVRDATSDDVDALVTIINRAYRVEEFFVTGDRIRLQDVVEKMSDPAATFLVIDEPADGGVRLLSAVYVRVTGDRGYFGPLAVDPSCQNRGLGQRMVAAAESYCRARGCRHVDIDVVNLRAELPRFYTALGYAVSGTKEFPTPERLRRPAHLVLMTKEI